MSVPCPHCGRLNRPGARYCASCQTPLSVGAAKLYAGQLLDRGTYRIERALGKGGMGAVWLVAQTKAFDRLAVLKEVIDYFDPADFEERKRALQRFEAEARTLGALKHPGIPDLYAYFSERGHNYLVMEFIDGPDLRKGLTREDGDTGRLISGGPLPIDDVLAYTVQVCDILEYLARQKPPVVHNDIKPGNIIIDENSKRAVLVDFGTAKMRYVAAGRPDPDKASIYGTVGYAAPELYQGRSESRSDVYSLAATAYHLLTDDDPRDHPFKYPQLDTLPGHLASILEGALAYEIDDRLSATEFRQELEGYLAGQSGPLRALTFPDGDMADKRDELLALAIKHWDYAAGLLMDGTLVNWLRRTLHDPVAAQAAEKAAIQWPSNADAALDAFVRALAPSALPPGKLELRTTSIRLPSIGANQQVVQEIRIANRGQGYLRGDVFSTQPWADVGSGRFGCPPGGECGVPIKVHTAGLAPGQTYLAAITLTPSGGGIPDVVAVQITVKAGHAGGTGTSVSPQAKPGGLRIDPSRVDVQLSGRDRNPVTKQVMVTNGNLSPAQIRVKGGARWLTVNPRSFALPPQARQVLEFTVRPDRVGRRSRQDAIRLVVNGGDEYTVDIHVQVSRQRGLLG